MRDYIIYKLSFPVGVHLGEGNLNTSVMNCRADTLFSALYIEALKLGKDKEFYEMAVQGHLLWSDLFPYDKENLYLPKPMIPISNADEGNSVEKKFYKKLKYIPASETEESVSNFETVVDEINALKAVNDEDVKNIIPMGSKRDIEAARSIYEKQKETGTEIYVEKMIDLSKIVSMQKLLNRDKLLHFVKYDKTKEKGDIIRAVNYGDKYVLLDGNHRVAMAILKKGKRLKVAVLNPIDTE